MPIKRIIRPKRCWVLIHGSGEYEDRCETPVKVFLKDEDAAKECSALQAHSHFFWAASDRKAAVAIVKKEYQKRGYSFADEYSDWTVIECPIAPDKE